MLPKVIPYKMLPYLVIILLSLAQDGLMVSKQQYPAHYTQNPIPAAQLSPFEMDAPEHLEALGSRLTVRIRLSPSLFNKTEFLESGINAREMYLQLGIYERNGDRVMLTQKKLKRAISANWQEVDFDCGWIVKGGKYFVYLLHNIEPDSSSASSDSRGESTQYASRIPTTLLFPSLTTSDSGTVSPPTQNQYGVENNQTYSFRNKEDPTLNQSSSQVRARILAKRTISIKYPTILFEVPTRLETYTTSAPVTFGLTKTICKPKLKLPSTMLTLTMCSFTVNENSGPSANHFSSNPEDNHIWEEGVLDISNPVNMPIPSFQLHKPSHTSSRSTSLAHHRGRNRERHHRRYNSDHHLSQSAQPLGSFRRQNASDDGNTTPEESESRVICHRDVATVFQEPLIALQTEGRVTINVECQLWGRNATYVIQLRETTSRNVIAQSSLISVEWSSQFSLELSKSSILRCQGSIRALISHPQCILPGRDKIRVYGYETLPVPSLLAPTRMSYIGEQKIRNNNRIISFRCNIFPPRFLRFCFQYVNTAVDDSVTVVVEKCIPTGPANKVADGGWSEWSKWSACSVTCGSGGKRFRYRVCDSPPPSSGANFCQGGAIQEEPCDTGIPCPQIPGRRQQLLPNGQVSSGEESGSLSPSGTGFQSPGELDHFGRDGGNRKFFSGSGRPSFMDFSVLNVSTTPGCECGCILYDLIPSKNYSLVILISANQSSCADEDEEDHHNFRWILHAKDEKDRIRLDIVGMDVQCVTMTFRDGNTTDSNLLEVITAAQPSDPIQFEGLYERELGQKAPVYQQQYQYDDEDDEEDSVEDESGEDVSHEEDVLYERSRHEDEFNENGDIKEATRILRIESTGPFLSIGTTSDSSKNCTGIAERKEEVVGYDFWTFLFLKIMVLFFIAVVVCSTFGGCVTKVYRKYKYKELKCFENEDEEGSLNEEGNSGQKNTRDTRDDASRCTSITLMSFDYSYWRRLRILRLKYFLLRPRPLDPVTTKVKSFPNTPTVSTKRKENASTSAGRNNTSNNAKPQRNTIGGDERVSKMQNCDDHHHKPLLLNKPISLSETNLREKSAVLAVTKNGYEIRRPWKRNSKVTTRENDCGKDASTLDIDMSGDPQQGSNPDHESVSDIYAGDGNASLTSTSVSISMSQSLNGSETASSNSITTPTPTPTPVFLDGSKKENSKCTRSELRSGAIKHLKEQENLKRKAGGERRGKVACPDESRNDGPAITPRSLSSSENSNRGGAIKKHAIRNREDVRGKGKRILRHGESTASVSTIQSTRTCDDDSSRVASRADLDDTDQDFEMDYYDYDVLNAGTIPGSYLGLEPAFVLWNSEVYQHSEDGVDPQDLTQDSPLGSRAHLAEDMKGVMDDSAYGIEMTSSSSSIGVLSGESNLKKDRNIRETSLDTLKFADDDDDDLDSFAESVDSIPTKNTKEIELTQLNKYNTISGGLGKT